jgi:hypothetical protein
MSNVPIKTVTCPRGHSCYVVRCKHQGPHYEITAVCSQKRNVCTGAIATGIECKLALLGDEIEEEDG